MSEYKYKPGDRVCVGMLEPCHHYYMRSGSHAGKAYQGPGKVLMPQRATLMNKTVTIAGYRDEKYLILEDKGFLSWTDEMFSTLEGCNFRSLL